MHGCARPSLALVVVLSVLLVGCTGRFSLGGGGTSPASPPAQSYSAGSHSSGTTLVFLGLVIAGTVAIAVIAANASEDPRPMCPPECDP